MQFAEATKLNGVVMTSSPSAMPEPLIARWRPAVPLLHATPKRRPAIADASASNSSTHGPIDSTPLRRTPTTASTSSSEMLGLAKGMARLGSGLIAMAAQWRKYELRAMADTSARCQSACCRMVARRRGLAVLPTVAARVDAGLREHGSFAWPRLEIRRACSRSPFGAGPGRLLGTRLLLAPAHVS